MAERGPPALGDLLRGHRERAGLTQEELAALIQPPLSVQTIGNVERGRMRPYRHTLLALCAALRVDESDRVRILAAWRGTTATDAAEVADALETGRAALIKGSWQEAFDRISAADATGPLSASDLEALGEAAMWSGHPPESIAARQRAHAAYERAGDRRGAARVALALVVNGIFRLTQAAAAGWYQKAQRSLEGLPEAPEHGYLGWMTAIFQLLAAHDPGAALSSARAAFDVGLRFRDPDLQTLCLAVQGHSLARLGRPAEGITCLDEAMASAIGGGLGPLASGFAYCWTLSTCIDLFDYRRAGEWTDAIQHSVARTGTLGYPGDCRVHRSMVLTVRGEWAEGEREARAAQGECATCDLRHVGLASYEIGEIRRRIGDLASAEEAYREAHELGALPQPGLALLRLAQGDGAAAAISIKGALEEVASDRLAAAKLLPAQVEIALAIGDVGTARSAADNLSDIAGAYDIPALEAAAAGARGAVQLADGAADLALPSLRRAVEIWRAADVPYEAARVRVRLAEALHSVGDVDTGALDLQAARSVFDRLGARLDAGRAAELANRLALDRPRG